VQSSLPWYVARSAGLVTWALLVASMVWGVLLATRALGRRPTPVWLLSMHRYLGGLACVFTVVHVGAVLIDRYVHFSVADALVPFSSAWRPGAVACGVVGLYLLGAIEMTSLARRRLPRRLWRSVHGLSYLLFASSTLHAMTAGTDVGALLSTAAVATISTITVFGGGLAWWTRGRAGPTEPARATTSGPTQVLHRPDPAGARR
jgi:DMSO/TMAO reductase YedYZ heme-binding membrane subunit